MTGEPPVSLPPDSQSPIPHPQPPDRYPFWGYADLFLVLSAWFVAIFIEGMLVHPTRAAGALLASAVSYAPPFLLLLAIFRLQYGRPFWRSLAWNRMHVQGFWVATAGLSTALAVNVIAWLIRTPNTPNPLTELMKDRPSMILIGIFGVTLGPLAEELIFRGFLQPLLIRSLGVVAGILLAAVPFGLLHFPEYGNSWRHALLISGAGAAFGWMRYATGSTRASTLMHAAYNALFFAALWGGKR
jgi:CAAX protease family protein